MISYVADPALLDLAQQIIGNIWLPDPHERSELELRIVNVLEKLAGARWRHENPDMSVFACDEELKGYYRTIIRQEIIA